ncbi:hypothetical protein DRE_03235 [Drechslerella stenobrocha 248]|uniref:Scaffold protein Nfu/NifU N-terminal domain-containing protein n=1 Tax=Drechslerella stenobrocha 248 TaxID=1043628 RepID=W7IEZ9_9PEZI|nr:hypothetical protein DRE_03235 [Drechslerella stenobrocha 248]
MASKPPSTMIRSLAGSLLRSQASRIATRSTSAVLHIPRRTIFSQIPSRQPPLLRHAYRPHPRPAAALPPQRRTLFIQTEPTPNPDALKFIPGLPVLPPKSASVEYTDGRQTTSSPLARSLFQLDGVHAVFYGPDFITVTKTPDSHWTYLKPEVFALITEHLNNGAPVVLPGDIVTNMDTAPEEGDSEVVSMIKELLDTRIRPAIQEDGGDIEYRGFTPEGQVLLKLRGACRTCDSSTVTLKNGIESMLMHYIEEVKGVTHVLDQEEEVAQREFERFEANLAKLKGAQAVPKTSGPHGIDAAP